MPIYEFVCPKCKNRFEELVIRRSDYTDVKCPECGYEETERVVSTFSGGAKGSGIDMGGCGSSSGFS
jgi:putative FmdB family regulatory protein